MSVGNCMTTVQLQLNLKCGSTDLKHVPFCLTVTVSVEMCVGIAKLRRKLQKIPKSRLLFLDETAVRLSEASTSTLVLPHEQQYVLATETTSYAKRFDMIAAVSGNHIFAPSIYTPSERKDEKARGINTEMLLDYIYNLFGSETAALDNPPLTLVLDRATIHSEAELLQAFRERGGHVMSILKMPTQAAKRMSPLDNALFHEWKERIRKHGPLTLKAIQQVMADEWNNLKPEAILPHYRKCGLTSSIHPFFDCPAPASHQHGK